MKDGFLYRRLNDPAHSFQESSSLRFAPKNPYDMILYAYPNYFAFELKSTQGKAFTFWREGLPSKGGYMIQKHQVEGLSRDGEHPGAVCGFLLNFRDRGVTYFLHIHDFMQLSKGLDKKSFNEKDIQTVEAIRLSQRLKRVKYDYDIGGLVRQLQQKYN